MKVLLISTILLFPFTNYSQTVNKSLYDIVHITSAYTSFPDTGRANGHLYDSVLYDAATHYSDSSVLVIIPKHLKVDNKVNMIFWFHGWRNNVDTAANYYHLIDQFIASDANAILVLPETTKNAPDSYGGKLEQQGDFKNLVNDVLTKLEKKKVLPSKCAAGNIVLAGHSGAFRVIAYILQNGQMPVQEVLLFDALYSQVDKFMHWIQQDSSHRFVHWFTNKGGGTDEVSEEMIMDLKEKNIPFSITEESDTTVHNVHASSILFVHSLREHNDIINNPDNFRLLLEGDKFLEK